MVMFSFRPLDPTAMIGTPGFYTNRPGFWQGAVGVAAVWAGIGDNGRPLPPGVYWVKTRAGDRSEVQKTILLK